MRTLSDLVKFMRSIIIMLLWQHKPSIIAIDLFSLYILFSNIGHVTLPWRAVSLGKQNIQAIWKMFFFVTSACRS